MVIPVIVAALPVDGIPSDLLEGLRKNDLGLALPNTGTLHLDLRCTGIFIGRWPISGHVLIQSSPIKVGVDHRLLIVEVLVQFFIGRRPVKVPFVVSMKPSRDTHMA
jgi:hypothetical protein